MNTVQIESAGLAATSTIVDPEPAEAPASLRQCRFCAAPLRHGFVDLGKSPLANSYLTAEMLGRMEPFFPLKAYVCAECLLVQLEAVESPTNIFAADYAYFSSFSDSWLEHARTYVDYAIDRFALGPQSQVIEIASNDGYLLQYFVARGIPALGIEPAANVAAAAVHRGVPTHVMFLNESTAHALADSGTRADLLIGNNVLAHVPDLNDFVRGLAALLNDDGVITLEFPHLLALMEQSQFDTIYHEHYSYFSLLAVSRVFAAHGLRLFDVEELSTHGGSLRIFVCFDQSSRVTSERVAALRDKEKAARLDRLETYLAFQGQVDTCKRDVLAFLINARRDGKSVVGYGAPAKGNTLLNYCGIRADLLEYTVDRSPHKQGRFLPGTQVPIHDPSRIRETKPDYVLILPWNLEREVVSQMQFVREWGGRFVVPIPTLRVL
jgi:SAM-dependent methyltransferase